MTEKANVVTADSLSQEKTDKFKYFAFISYKREDSKWAEWLQKKLQSYRLPSRICKENIDLPKRLVPVFLDKTDLPPGVLKDSLFEYTKSSKYLIVICSKATHDNPDYINLEIQDFLDSGHTYEQIIPFIVDDSETPEVDCFPSLLQKINSEHELIGVNINDNGKNRAFLKVVAYMHGISVSEIENADDKRRKRNKIIMSAVAIFGVLGISLCLDYFVPKTKYYLDYTTVYGVPHGIHELSEKEISRMSAHYAIVSSRKLVRELRYENSYGTLIKHMNSETADRPTKAVYSYRENGVLEEITHYDEKNKLVLSMNYADENLKTVDLNIVDSNGYIGGFSISASMGTLSYSSIYGDSESIPDDYLIYRTIKDLFAQEDEHALENGSISRYLIDYDEDGYTQEIRYVSEREDNVVGTDENGVAGLRYETDEKGRVTEIWYLTNGEAKTANEKSKYVKMSNAYGVSGRKYTYDDDKLALTEYVAEDGTPILNEEQWSGCKTEFDEDNNVSGEVYLDVNGEPTLSVNGVVRYIAEYDDYGNRISESYYDSENKLTDEFFGFATVRLEYDKKGNMVSEAYFDKDGNSVMFGGCYATEYTYDEKSNITDIVFLDSEGKTMNSDYGYASMKFEYNGNGECVKNIYLDADGNPISSSWGYACCERIYTDGKLTEISYFDEENNFVSGISEGYVKAVVEYNENGDASDISLFGADGNPVICSYGFASVEIFYDEHGNPEKIVCYDVGNNKIKDITESDILEHKFFNENISETAPETEDNNEITTKPVNDTIVNIVDEKDANGNIISATYYNSDGEQVSGEYGYSKILYGYDKNNNLVNVEFFNPDGSRALSAETKISIIKREYNEDNRITKESFYGIDEKPKNCADGCATVEYEYSSTGDLQLILKYDEKWNLVEESYYDGFGTRRLCKDGYATSTCEYDKNGNPVKVRHYGVDGKPIISSDGVAGFNYKYDSKGNNTVSECIGTDGNLILSHLGTSYWKMEYDDNGNQTRIEHYGVNGEPAYYNGYNVRIREYDENGNMTKESYYDHDGEPVLSVDGYASKTMTYDSSGNIIKETHYNTRGKVVR